MRHPNGDGPAWCMDCYPERYEKYALRDGPTVLAPSEQPKVSFFREEAIQRADDHVLENWKAHADAVIEATARRYREFTSEQVWDMGLRKPNTGSSDGDALGPAMRRAVKAGIIANTGRLEQATNRPQRHNNPKRIWLSLIYDARPAR